MREQKQEQEVIAIVEMRGDGSLDYGGGSQGGER